MDITVSVLTIQDGHEVEGGRIIATVFDYRLHNSHSLLTQSDVPMQVVSHSEVHPKAFPHLDHRVPQLLRPRQQVHKSASTFTSKLPSRMEEAAVEEGNQEPRHSTAACRSMDYTDLDQLMWIRKYGLD